MSWYSRYSESSISVSYFSRSSALIGSVVLLVGWSHLSSPKIPSLLRLPIGPFVTGGVTHHHLVFLLARKGAVTGASDVHERVSMLGARTQLGKGGGVRLCAVALVQGETVAREALLHGHHEAVPAHLRQHAGRRNACGSRV